MKKEYINPKMDVIKMETMSVLAESLTQNQETPASVSNGEYTNSCAGEFFGGDDSSEDW